MSLASIGNMLASIFRPKSGFSLSSLLPFGSLIDSGVGLISGLSNNIYDRQLQQTIFERDDTQLTRLMKEYQRNGLNPLLGLPGASVGNTKGFEPSQIQSNFSNAYAQKLQLDSLKLQNKNMDIQNDIARQELHEKKMTNSLDRMLMKAKINANRTHFTDYFDTDKYKNLFDDGTTVGVDFSGQSEIERGVRAFLNYIDSEKKSQTAKEENYNNSVKSLDKFVTEGKMSKHKPTVGSTYWQYTVFDSKFRIRLNSDGSFSVTSPDNNIFTALHFDSLEGVLNYCQDYARQ